MNLNVNKLMPQPTDRSMQQSNADAERLSLGIITVNVTVVGLQLVRFHGFRYKLASDFLISNVLAISCCRGHITGAVESCIIFTEIIGNYN